MPKYFVIRGYDRPGQEDNFLITPVEVLDTIRTIIEQPFPLGARYVSYHPSVQVRELPMDDFNLNDNKVVTVEMNNFDKLPWYEFAELNVYPSNDFFLCAEDNYSTSESETFSIDELILAMDKTIEVNYKIPNKCSDCIQWYIDMPNRMCPGCDVQD